ncbi:MAG: hypothetical protein H6832_18055 [Planctomycetes bacterium]|nr:hypothetical protein [Planctomycetota bacterium]
MRVAPANRAESSSSLPSNLTAFTCSLLSVLGACASSTREPAAPALPVLRASSTWHAGTVLEGGQTRLPSLENAANDPEQGPTSRVARAHVEVRWLESLPARVLDPIASHARLLISETEADPIVSTVDAMSTIRIARGDAAEAFWTDAREHDIAIANNAGRDTAARAARTAAIGDTTLVVPRGYTARYDLLVGKSPDASLHFAFDVLPRAGDEDVVRVAVVTRGRVSDEPVTDGDGRLVVLEEPLRGTEDRVVVLLRDPAAVGLEMAGALAISLTADTVSATDVTSELAQCTESARASALDAEQRNRTPSPDELRRMELESAFEALARSDGNRRAAVSSLVRSDAGEPAPPLIADLVRTVDQTTFGAFADSLAASKDSILQVGTDPALIAWQVERRAWSWLVARAQAEGFDDVLEAMLLRQSGEVGRYPSSVQSFANRAKNTADMTKRLEAENLLLLEDGNPGSRVRAYDWLALRDLAPEGFDPLATLEDRRAALEAFREKRN